MTAFTRCENAFSSSGRVVCYSRVSVRSAHGGGGEGREKEKVSHLATTEDFVAGEVEDVHDELRHGVPADPQEDRLAVLDEEQAVALEPL